MRFGLATFVVWDFSAKNDSSGHRIVHACHYFNEYSCLRIFLSSMYCLTIITLVVTIVIVEGEIASNSQQIELSSIGIAPLQFRMKIEHFFDIHFQTIFGILISTLVSTRKPFKSRVKQNCF